MSVLIRVESKRYFAALGAHIAALRKAHKFTQAEVARAVGVTPQAVHAFELGERRISVLILSRMAKTFDVPVEDLIRMGRPMCTRNRRLSPKAIRHAQRLQALSKTNQRFVIRIINVLEDTHRRGDARS